MSCLPNKCRRSIPHPKFTSNLSRLPKTSYHQGATFYRNRRHRKVVTLSKMEFILIRVRKETLPQAAKTEWSKSSQKINLYNLKRPISLVTWTWNETVAVTVSHPTILMNSNIPGKLIKGAIARHLVAVAKADKCSLEHSVNLITKGSQVSVNKILKRRPHWSLESKNLPKNPRNSGLTHGKVTIVEFRLRGAKSPNIR